MLDHATLARHQAAERCASVGGGAGVEAKIGASILVILAGAGAIGGWTTSHTLGAAALGAVGAPVVALGLLWWFDPNRGFDPHAGW
jgi:hypothetical protein